DYWYKRYIQAKVQRKDIQKEIQLSFDLNLFWNRIKQHFKFEKNIKFYVSDSHALSYKIAKENDCQEVYLFDAHADLGYGGPTSLDFEVNCSNWLGKLLKDNKIKNAYIFYSPYTVEKPEYFETMNNIYNIKYYDFHDLNDKSIMVSAIHICRSGAWTPPWLDDKFFQFVNSLGLPYDIKNCPKRKWDPDHISLSDEIIYLIE
ncbi:MAG TPA: arginase, partial [Clostridia bacterium]